MAGDEVVCLAMSHDKKIRVIKAMRPKPGTPRDGARKQIRALARMKSPYLATVLAAPDVEADGGLVMERVRGRSLAAISQRAEDYSVLLPPELGLVVAYDVLAALEHFHGFERRGHVHGNLSGRTLLVGFSGEVKLAGYRPGTHAALGLDAGATDAAKDWRALATVLSELAFERFPQELAVLVPRLLDDDTTPADAVTAARAFLRQYQPTAEQRRKVTAWLDDVFLGERDAEAEEEERLLAEGRALLGPRRPVARAVAWASGSAALVVLIGGGVLWATQRHRAAGLAPEALGTPPLPTLALAAPGVAIPVAPPLAALEVAPTGAAPAFDATPDPAPAAPAEASPRAEPGPAAAVPERPSRRGASSSAGAERLLRAADAAFVAGNRVEAINLGLRAVRAGGGIRAHLALGEYYRSMLRYEEALSHYRAVLTVDPDNPLGAAGVRLLEKRVASTATP